MDLDKFKKYYEKVMEQRKFCGAFHCWFGETLEKYVLNQKVAGIKFICYNEPNFENAVNEIYDELLNVHREFTLQRVQEVVDGKLKEITSKSVCNFFGECFYNSIVTFYQDLKKEYQEEREPIIPIRPARKMTEEELLFFGY